MENFEVVETDARGKPNAALGTLPPSTNTGYLAPHGLHRKGSASPLVSVVIPGVHSSTSPTRYKTIISPQHSSKNQPYRETAVSVDEQRLLGEIPKKDPHAVSIQKPTGTKPNSCKRAQIPSGFVPRNTLDPRLSSNQAQTNGRSQELLNRQGRKRNQLDIKISMGDNVRPSIPETEPHTSLNEERNPKRRKLTSPLNFEMYADVHGAKNDDSQVDQPQLHQKPGHTYQNRCRFSDHEVVGEYFEMGGVTEYDTLEKTMDSTLRRKTGVRKGKRGSPFYHSASISPPQALAEMALPDSGQPGIISSTYKGTARPERSNASTSESALNGALQYDNGTKSKYFPTSRGSPSDLLDGERRLPSDDRARERFTINQLKEQSGMQRVPDLRNISSDELERETTVGNHALINLASPDRSSRSISPTKSQASTLNTTVLEGVLGELPPSTIPYTHWTKQIKNRQIEKEPWEIDLAYISANGISLEGPALHLEYNEKHNVYHVVFQGKQQNHDVQIDPGSIHKALWAQSSTKLRLEVLANKMIYIQMFTHHDVCRLLEAMQRKSRFKVEPKPSDWMDKVFDRGPQLERKAASKIPRSGIGVDPQDVQMAILNKKRRDDTQQAANYTIASFPKRRPPRLIDQMHEDTSEKPRDHKRVDRTPASPNRSSDIILDVSKFSRRIHQRLPNPHLRGSRIQLDQPCRQAIRFSNLEESLQELAHAKPVDLGTPWREPLLFPKAGKKKASVEFEDLERLREGEFLNDNLIGFYLRFLEEQLGETHPEIAKTVYFFNTFFFASLTNTQRGKKGFNYEAVEKWTRSIDVFGFDYVVVPINESAHWYLAIICNLRALIPRSFPARRSAELTNTESLHQEQINKENFAAGGNASDRPSSPLGNITHAEHVHSSENESGRESDVGDQAPTASFAEMSLEPEQIVGIEQQVDEQRILDAQINDDLVKNTVQSYETPSSNPRDDAPSEDGEDIVNPPHDQKVYASNKKRKRKSVAPITKMKPETPVILMFDSLGQPHPRTTRILKDYLREEGRAKRRVEWDEQSIKGVTAKGIPLQNNFCDCGLFLLGYVDKFLDDPKEFTSKILARQYDSEKDWLKLNPSELRVSIRQQIMDLHEQQDHDEKEKVIKPDQNPAQKPLSHKTISSAGVNVRPEKYQVLYPTRSPIRQRVPKSEVTSPNGVGRKQTSEKKMERGTQVEIKAEAPQSPKTTPRSRDNSPQLVINVSTGMSIREALKGLGIGAALPQNLVDTCGGEVMDKNMSFPGNSLGLSTRKPGRGYQMDRKTSRPAATSRQEDRDIRQANDSLQLGLPPSTDSTKVVSIAQELDELFSVIDGSEHDLSREMIRQRPSTSSPQRPAHKADDDTHHDFRRSSPTAQGKEQAAAPSGRLTRPSKPRQQRQSSVIELD